MEESPFSLDLERRHRTLMRTIRFLIRYGGAPLALLVSTRLYYLLFKELDPLEQFVYFGLLVLVGFVAVTQNWSFMASWREREARHARELAKERTDFAAYRAERSGQHAHAEAVVSRLSGMRSALDMLARSGANVHGAVKALESLEESAIALRQKLAP